MKKRGSSFLNEEECSMCTIHTYGSPKAPVTLLQCIESRDLPSMESELAAIRTLTNADFQLIALQVEDWNRDLSPWPAPAVFGKEGFAGGADKTLAALLPLCQDKSKRYILGGYSLAGLFALWAACQTDAFDGIVAASPSVWFPDFVPYMKEHPIKSDAVYLSLGDREPRTRNPVMATVGDCLEACRGMLTEQGTPCTLEWNQGNHFQEPDARTAKGFAWVMKQLRL